MIQLQNSNLIFSAGTAACPGSGGGPPPPSQVIWVPGTANASWSDMNGDWFGDLLFFYANADPPTVNFLTLQGTGITGITIRDFLPVLFVLQLSNNPLVSVDVTGWVITNGASISVINCALNAASVNQILNRAVASGVTTCFIDLSGGTSSPPTGQGIIDKTVLILAGNTVNTN